MTSPWLDIPLDEYEAHMALPSVGQAQLIAEQLRDLVRQAAPQSVAVIGCAGGNGFDHLAEMAVTRVVGVDINPQYLEKARQVYAAKIPNLELYTADIQSGESICDAVDLIYAALIFEYVDIPATMNTLRRLCKPTGLMATLIQMPHESLGPVSSSPYTRLKKLEPAMKLVSGEELVGEARRSGFVLEGSTAITTGAGKEFTVQIFRFGVV
jgi:trans-aconitate methyltransferase